MKPGNRKERILIYGRPGSGKSSCWASIAEWEVNTNGPATIYVGDTDRTWEAMRDEVGSDIQQTVKATTITSYIDALEWAKETRKLATPDDWVVFDLADKAYLWAQDHYYGSKDSGEDYFLANVYLDNQISIENKQEGMGGSHGQNWGVIYKFYFGLINTVLNLPCHVMFCNAAAEIRSDTKPAIVNQFKGVGFYPSSPPDQKRIEHSFHTVIFAAEMPERFIYTTVKERGFINKPHRELMKGVTVTDFVQDYLFPIGGWRP